MKDLYQGVVYFIQHREIYSSKSHYLVVLNPDPTCSELLVFGVITSGIEKAEKRIFYNKEKPETLVKISPEDYPELDHDSVIDCNTPVKYSKMEFEKSFASINSNRKTDMPSSICKAIVNGVILSRQVPQKIKNALIQCTTK